MDPVIHDQLRILTDAFMVLQKKLKIVEDSITAIYIREMELDQEKAKKEAEHGHDTGIGLGNKPTGG